MRIILSFGHLKDFDVRDRSSSRFEHLDQLGLSIGGYSTSILENSNARVAGNGGVNSIQANLRKLRSQYDSANLPSY